MIFICILALLIFTGISFFSYKRAESLKSLTHRCAVVFVAVLIFSIGLEVSLFNVNFYLTQKNTPIDLSAHLSENTDHNGEYSLIGEKEIEISELNTEIDNIKIVLGEEAPESVNVTLYLTDEANEYYFKTPERTIYKNVEKSQYISVATAGASTHLKLRFDTDDYILKVKSLSVNEKREFDFSFVRVALLTSILLFLYIFKPSSPIHKIKLVESKEWKSSVLIVFIALQCAVFLIIGTLNPAFLGYTSGADGITFVPLSMQNHNQYDELAQAILDGKTYIDNDDVPQSLLDLENPYDTTARTVASQASGDHYRWDVAFFNGHYYVYFGIVPLLLMYLPFRAFFDAPFPSVFGIIIFATVFAVGVLKLLEIIANKYFRKISVGTYLLTALSFINCCGAMFLVKRPDFYSVPIICAMAFIVWGIYWWIKGKDAPKKQNLYFALGSACCALAVGCRPQSVLMCAVALPLFCEFLFKGKRILKADGVKNTLALGIPFVVVAAGIMYYNYIRFGSPFDFGSGYNLTTNDVTRRGFEIGRTGLGIFTYLFQTPSFTATFPYITDVDIETSYAGKTIYEYCFGGLITCTPVLWFIGALPNVKSSLKKNKLLGFTVITLLVGIATVIADTQAGGLLQRYYCDFGFVFFLAAVLVILALCEKVKSKEGIKNLNTIIYALTVLSVIYSALLVFSVADATIDVLNPTLFGKISHLVQFWL